MNADSGKQPCEIVAEQLNRDCHCISVDAAALHRQLHDALNKNSVGDDLIAQRPHLFAQFGVFVAQARLEAMARIIQSIGRAIALPAYQSQVLGWAPAVAQHEVPTTGVLFGYDFHLGTDGPRLVEINTNAGGAMLNAVLARAQVACCAEVEQLAIGGLAPPQLDGALFEMFAAEWRKARGTAPLRTVAIVDDAPTQQYLYPEFLLFQSLFRAHGVAAMVVDPQQLQWRDGALWCEQQRIDLVYNRLTDFYLDEPAHAALRAAYLADAAVITPQPRAHALYANKRNLTLLSDAALLRSWGLDEADAAVLAEGIPRTLLVTADNAETLWAERRQLFFKPLSGYGSKAVYRGDKLTRRVWSEILAGDYVAQSLVLPSERRMRRGEELLDLKVDVRAYVYEDRILLLTARLYQGQTTNFRTAGGGFAPVYTVPCAVPQQCAHP